jgi:hypothetical protein
MFPLLRIVICTKTARRSCTCLPVCWSHLSDLSASCLTVKGLVTCLITFATGGSMRTASLREREKLNIFLEQSTFLLQQIILELYKN